jgi:beta-aspartyl-peptidase (threonine type)
MEADILLHPEHLAGCREAAGVGWDLLSSGRTAIEAVEAAIRVMEDNPVFDAGRGSHLNRDGEVELDAGIMDGQTLMAGAVAGIKRVAHPITLARHVLFDSEHVFLVSSGAERFAIACGMPLCENADLIVARELEAWDQRRREEAAPPDEGSQPSSARAEFRDIRRGHGWRRGAGFAGNLAVATPPAHLHAPGARGRYAHLRRAYADNQMGDGLYGLKQRS